MAAGPASRVRTGDWRRIKQFAVHPPTRPCGLAIAGEAGAGKSTLWRAAVDAAVGAGYRVLRSEPSPAEAQLSFAGLSDLLGDILPTVTDAVPAPQRDALEVALLLRPAGEIPPTAHAIGQAVLSVLRAALADRPIMIGIDDVQWLDDASLDALVFALRRLTAETVSVLLAARAAAPADPLTVGVPPPPRHWHDLLDAVATSERIDLAPLNVRQIRTLLPADVNLAQARLVADQSRGNPFWAKEISAASLESPGSPLTPTAQGLSRRLTHLLGADAVYALAVVAAAGHVRVSDSLKELRVLPDPVTALDSAALAGAVVETGGRLVPAHPLIGAAALEALPPGRRRNLYEHLAAESINPERHARFLALAAGTGPDPAVAEALEAAAEAAHNRAANAVAGHFATQAVSFTPTTDGPHLIARRIRAGELLFLAGNVADSVAHLGTLDLDGLATPDLERALPLLLDMTDVVHGTTAATTIIANALQTAGLDRRRRALVLALAADVAYGIPGKRHALAVEAIGCAQAAGTAAEPALHRALLNLVAAKAAAAEGLDTDLLDQAGRLESSIAVTRQYDTANLQRGLWSRYVDDLETARAAVTKSIGQAAESGDDYAQATFLAYLAATEQLAGDYTSARVALDAADAIAAWHHWPASAWRLEPTCEQLIADGKLTEARHIVDTQLVDEAHTPVEGFIAAVLRGKVSAWENDPAATVVHLERAARWADENGWKDPGVRSRLDALLAEAYVDTDRAADAARISSTLREIGTRLERTALIGDAERIDALIAAHLGDLDAAAGLARSAVAAHEASPLRLEAARSLLVLGRIERRRRARKHARTALTRARDLATDVAHRPLLAEVERELPRTAGTRSSNALTTTEQRVAELIAEGASNRDAATALFVSVRTIETHLATIYRKLGIHRRAELTRRLSQNNI